MSTQASGTTAERGLRMLQGFAPVPEDFRLQHGGRVVDGRIAYRLTGIPGNPVVAVLGGISADRVVSAQEEDRGAGWWEWMAGEGRPLDEELRGCTATLHEHVLGDSPCGAA